MDARAKTVRDILFGGDQYLIPFFQRHYSWKLRNWERLWDDLKALLEDTKPRTHFMGPLVCTPINHMPGEIPEYQLIDGQQRLTTITTLLAAMRDLAKETNQSDLAEDIEEKFLVQKREKGLKRYKLIPRVGDREVLFGVIDGKGAEYSRRDGIVRAHRFFKAALQEYIRGDEEKNLNKLIRGVTSQLSLVVITVDGENPYEIFESLNSTGLPLEESDLIRNFIFMKVPLAEQEEFHKYEWQPFEAMFDAGEDTEPLDPTSFYRDYLMREGVYSRRKMTFVDFKEHIRARELGAVPLVEELRKYAKLERMIKRRDTHADAEVDAALQRLSKMEISTANPLLLNLLNRHEVGKLTRDDLLACLSDLESFVLRRSICGESTRNYSDWFPAVIRELGETPVEKLREFWGARGWPDDATFTSNLVEFPLYRRESLKTEVMLKRLEKSFEHKEGPDLDEMTVEHVLPQSIEDGKRGKAWQEMLGEKWGEDHAAWVHTLGNLTLTGYNSNLSNREFEKKKELFNESNIQLNRYFNKLPRWDTTLIQKRGQELAVQIAELWPRKTDVPYRPGKPDPLTLSEGFGDRKQFRALREEFWIEFLEKFEAAHLSTKKRFEPGDRFDLSFKTTRKSCKWAIELDPDEACVCVQLIFGGEDAERNLEILRQEEETIEAELGHQLEWLSEPGWAAAAVYLDSAQPMDRADWDRQHGWLIEWLRKFIDVLGPRLMFNDENQDAKKLIEQFWELFDQRAQMEIPQVGWATQGRKTYRDYEIASGVSLILWTELSENWIWAGLCFHGKKHLELLEQATPKMEALRVTPKDLLLREVDEKESWLGNYRYFDLANQQRWESLFPWLVSVAAKSVALGSTSG